mmetsp:Transcript_13548/g.37118  ORF Transcript_13548/g.37118 Transcript_13548/m.37118 type:complete len:271 (+) Transcript_13548:45-857(+)
MKVSSRVTHSPERRLRLQQPFQRSQETGALVPVRRGHRHLHLRRRRHVPAVERGRHLRQLAARRLAHVAAVQLPHEHSESLAGVVNLLLPRRVRPGRGLALLEQDGERLDDRLVRGLDLLRLHRVHGEVRGGLGHDGRGGRRGGSRGGSRHPGLHHARLHRGLERTGTRRGSVRPALPGSGTVRAVVAAWSRGVLRGGVVIRLLLGRRRVRRGRLGRLGGWRRRGRRRGRIERRRRGHRRGRRGRRGRGSLLRWRARHHHVGLAVLSRRG